MLVSHFRNQRLAHSSRRRTLKASHEIEPTSLCPALAGSAVGFGGRIFGGRLRLSAVAQACRLEFLGTIIFKVRRGELRASFGFRKCFCSHDFLAVASSWGLACFKWRRCSCLEGGDYINIGPPSSCNQFCTDFTWDPTK